MTAFSQGIFLCLIFFIVDLSDVKTQEITIQSIKPVHRVSEAFISYNIDPNILLNNEFNSESTSKMLTMARALSPMYVRLAGPSTFLYQFVGNTPSKNSTLMITESHIEALGNFAQAANLRFVLALNAATRTKDGDWDVTQTKHLLQLADNLALDVGVQMGYDRLRSEPSVSGASLAKDIEMLAQLFHKIPRYSDSLILGPDVSNLDAEKEVSRCMELLTIASNSLSAVTWHPTPFMLRPSKDGEKVADRATGAYHTLEIASRQLNNLLKMTPASRKDIWLGGTITPRGRYVDAMMLITRLGQAARLGISVVLQTLNYETLVNPSPEFWASVLYRQLVGRDVLDTRLHDGDRRRVHVFTHCSRQSGTSGGVTVFAVNYSPHDCSSNIKTRWTSQTTSGIRKYVLTSTNDLLSRTILLNGKVLDLLPNGDVPILEPELLPFNYGNRINIFIPKHSISFWEFPMAHAKACMHSNDYKSLNLPVKKRISNITKREIQDSKTSQEKVHLLDPMISAKSGNSKEENYMHGSTMYALLMPTSQSFEPIQYEAIDSHNVTENEKQETEIKVDLLLDDALNSELSPAELYFGFGEVSPGEKISSVEELAEVKDELYAAEYKASINEINVTSTELSNPSSEKDESTMFVISRLLHSNNVTDNKDIGIEEKMYLNYDKQHISKSTNETTEFPTTTNSSEIKYLDASTANNIASPILLYDSVKLTNNSEFNFNQNQTQNGTFNATPSPDLTIETTTILSIQPTEDFVINYLLAPSSKKADKSLDEDTLFENITTQTKLIHAISEENIFSVINNDMMEATTHEMPKRDLQSYKSFLISNNFQVNGRPYSNNEKTHNTHPYISNATTETGVALITEETSEASVSKFTFVEAQDDKNFNLENKLSHINRNSYKSRGKTTHPTLEDAIRKRVERIQELREKIATLKNGEVCKGVIKRQADEDWGFDNPEEPVLDLPLNNTDYKTGRTVLNDLLPRMNFPRIPKLKFDLATFSPRVRPTLAPQTFPMLKEITLPTLPALEISTLPPFTEQSFPTLNPENNFFTLPSLLFTLPTPKSNKETSNEVSSEETGASIGPLKIASPLTLPPLTLPPPPEITTPTPNTSSPISLLEKIRAKLAAKFPPRSRQRRHLKNDNIKKLETLNIPMYIQANIPLLRLPPLIKPTGKTFETPLTGQNLESRSTNNSKKHKNKPNSSEIVFDENGTPYKKVKPLHSMSGKTHSDHGSWPDEYHLERFSGGSSVFGGSDWPFHSGRKRNDKMINKHPTSRSSCPSNCYARRAKRSIGDLNVENFRNSLLYRFKKWELEDKLNQIDNTINNDIWGDKKIVVATIPNSQKNEAIEEVVMTKKPITPISESTLNSNINKVSQIKEAVHKFVLVPVVRGVNRVFCSFRNFLNGARSC